MSEFDHELTGPELRAWRERINVARATVADNAGITVQQLLTVESGGTRAKVLTRLASVAAVLEALETSGEHKRKVPGRRKKDTVDIASENTQDFVSVADTSSVSLG